MNNVIMIMNARKLSGFRDAMDKLNISKVWFKGFKEYELNVEINKFIEPISGAVLAKVIILVFIILFIQKRPRGLFPKKGRDAED